MVILGRIPDSDSDRWGYQWMLLHRQELKTKTSLKRNKLLTTWIILVDFVGLLVVYCVAREGARLFGGWCRVGVLWLAILGQVGGGVGVLNDNYCEPGGSGLLTLCMALAMFYFVAERNYYIYLLLLYILNN